MPSYIIADEVPGQRLWNCTLPNGERREELTAVDVQELAFQWRATCLHPLHAAEYENTKARCVAIADSLAADGYLYCARDGEEPAERTLTPTILREILKANGIPDCNVWLDHGVFCIDPPLPNVLLASSIRIRATESTQLPPARPIDG